MTTPVSPGYNERSWAIDVISEINIYSATRNRAIVRAGGEHTVSGQSGSLFPDVLLFGDSNGSIVQQGWELKMPDTAINDSALLVNAELKARRLGLSSYVVWNADEAVLYTKDTSDNFIHTKAWPGTNIKRRADVRAGKVAWIKLLHQIIDDVNDLLDHGSVTGARPDAAISDVLFVDYLEYFVPTLSLAIQQACQSDATFSAELKLWWIENGNEHPGCTEFQAMARVNLINWINRILFAHYLKRFNNAAGVIESIVPGTTVQQAIAVFNAITASCDFMNVFKPPIGQDYVDIATWDGLISLNSFLKDFNLNNISQQSFHHIIDTALNYSRKKLAGQFSTPRPLADLLVRLSIKDRTKSVIDATCGTGTIARAAYELKKSLGISVTDALRTTWASDKFAFPLQLSSIALSDPLGMGEVVQVFRHDAFLLTTGKSIDFTDPNTGAVITRSLPLMHAAISNLPFVRFEDVDKLNPSLGPIRATLGQDCSGNFVLENRADLYAYLVLKLRELIDDNGRIGFISSNSWLSVNWGNQFKEILMRCFNIRQIVISGEGRWFSNADVVTTIMVLEKRSATMPVNENIEFLTTTKRIEDWDGEVGGVDLLATQMLVSNTSGTGYTKVKYTHAQIQQLVSVGIGWNALFADLSWVSQILVNLVPASGFFDINRGERRGWDDLFYPEPGHGIEPQYIRRVLKSARDIDGLIAVADRDAFCCPDDIATLNATGMTGALAWIARFQNALNGTNKPLPDVLAMPGYQWYEMSASTLADFVVCMNPDQRLAVHRFNQRSFVNQRLIRFVSQPLVDIDLCHALMNSVIGMFLIEAIGFGRGLGALDLNPTKMSAHLHMLDPGSISAQDRAVILSAFAPLLTRDVLNLTVELKSQDRIDFDKVVLKAYGIAHLQNQIYDSLRKLFHIRQTARV